MKKKDGIDIYIYNLPNKLVAENTINYKYDSWAVDVVAKSTSKYLQYIQ